MGQGLSVEFLRCVLANLKLSHGTGPGFAGLWLGYDEDCCCFLFTYMQLCLCVHIDACKYKSKKIN